MSTKLFEQQAAFGETAMTSKPTQSFPVFAVAIPDIQRVKDIWNALRHQRAKRFQYPARIPAGGAPSSEPNRD